MAAVKKMVKLFQSISKTVEGGEVFAVEKISTGKNLKIVELVYVATTLSTIFQKKRKRK